MTGTKFIFATKKKQLTVLQRKNISYLAKQILIAF